MKKDFLKKASIYFLMQLLISGCVNSHEYCRQLGFIYGTKEYGACVMYKDEQQKAAMQQTFANMSSRNTLSSQPSQSVYYVAPCRGIWCENPNGKSITDYF